MALRAVLFDLFGTLLVYGDMKQAWSEWRRVMGSYALRLGVSFDDASLSQDLDGFFARAVAPESGLLSVYEIRLRDWMRGHGVDPDPTWCRALADHSLEVWQRFVTVDFEAAEVLRTLHGQGLRLGLVTNFDHPPHVHALLQHHDLVRFLDVVVISGEVGLKKPDPKIFELALKTLGCKASESAFVGDHPELDGGGADGLGMRAILIARGSGLDRLHSDYHADLESAPAGGALPMLRIGTLAELPALLESLA